MDAEPRQHVYEGPYILMRDERTGKSAFIPARQVDSHWVALTPEEYQAAMTEQEARRAANA